jgi:hypothetical protein
MHYVSCRLSSRLYSNNAQGVCIWQLLYLDIDALIEGAEKLVRDYGCTAIAVVVSTLRVVLWRFHSSSSWSLPWSNNALSIILSINLTIYQSFYLSIDISINHSIYQSIYQSIYTASSLQVRFPEDDECDDVLGGTYIAWIASLQLLLNTAECGLMWTEGSNTKSAADLFSAYRSGAGVDGIAGAEVAYAQSCRITRSVVSVAVSTVVGANIAHNWAEAHYPMCTCSGFFSHACRWMFLLIALWLTNYLPTYPPIYLPNFLLNSCLLTFPPITYLDRC